MRGLWFIAAALSLAGVGVRAADAPASPPEIKLQKQGHGWILADSKGMTLYVTRADLKGKPSCDGACAKTWPPLTAPADAKPPVGVWSIATRADGTKQWAFEGKPLYAYSHDIAPGDTNGDELLQQWSVALMPFITPPGFASLKNPLGQFLVDRQRMTLYALDADSATQSKCTDACARQWKPVEAWWTAVSPGADWSMLQRADGTRQWAYLGKPLYRYSGDVNPGDALGDGIKKGWHAFVLQPAPPMLPWLTRQKSDGGELYADAKGMTIYAYDLSHPRPLGIGFVRDLETPENWRPLVPKDSDKPLGQFSIVAKEDGSKQWAYKGMLLFTNINDHEPGDINGVRSIDRLWRPIMTSGQTMPGTGT